VQGVKVKAADKVSLEIIKDTHSPNDPIIGSLCQFLNNITVSPFYPTGEDVETVFALPLTASLHRNKEFVSNTAAYLNNFNAYLNKSCHKKFASEP
jgi:hypothetical protein